MYLIIEIIPLDVYGVTKLHIKISFLQDQWANNMISDKNY